MEKLKSCVLWQKPELVKNKNFFKVVETYRGTSHLWRHLLKCNECGQLYFHELFMEPKLPKKAETDKYATWIPVITEEAKTLKYLHPLELLVDSAIVPRIHQDIIPEGRHTVYWMK